MSLKNIPLKVFRHFLSYKGLKKIRTKGGHETWARKDLTRPVVIQTHENPIPEFIIKSNLRTIGSNRQEFENWLNPNTTKSIPVSTIVGEA